MDPLKMYSLLKMGIFHFYVSLPEGIFLVDAWNQPEGMDAKILSGPIYLIGYSLVLEMFGMLSRISDTKIHRRVADMGNLRQKATEILDHQKAIAIQIGIPTNQKPQNEEFESSNGCFRK